MWRSRFRATFLSNRDEVDAGDEPAITHKTGYDIYRLLALVICSQKIVQKSYYNYDY